METHEQYLVGVLQKYKAENGKEHYMNAAIWDKNARPGQRYYRNEAAAREALKNAYKLWNGAKCYDANGKRIEQTDTINGIGIALVTDKKHDDDMRIVKHYIKKRIVTEWEQIE